jgi:ABC-type multidrug transport system ATPase subunit
LLFFSGGQRRRISVGTTLLTRSSLIMLDEPTAGIDPITRRQIWQLLLAVRQQRIAILLTSHSMDECEELCNKIGFLNRGKLVGIGSSQHLKSRYKNNTFFSSNLIPPICPNVIPPICPNLIPPICPNLIPPICPI